MPGAVICWNVAAPLISKLVPVTDVNVPAAAELAPIKFVSMQLDIQCMFPLPTDTKCIIRRLTLVVKGL